MPASTRIKSGFGIITKNTNMHKNINEIGNSQLRQLWLAAHGLASAPSGAIDVMSIIRRLGFLQIDTVRNVVRAHDHILWSRNTRYREGMVWDALRRRELFEHFTHDASLIPMDFYPLWQRQFERLGQRAARAEWYQSGLAQAETEAIHARIKAEGPLSTHAFDSPRDSTDPRDSTEMWSRPPHKKALEQMWYAGVLATAARHNFAKYYDLGARVFPPLPPDRPDAAAAGAMLCDLAMDRMGIANAGEIRRFWDAVPPAEVRDWIASRGLMAVRVQAADGTWQDSWAAPDLTARLEALLPPSTRMRIINPLIWPFVTASGCTGFSDLNIPTRCSYRRPNANGAITSIRFLKGTALLVGWRPRLTAMPVCCVSPDSGQRPGSDGGRGASPDCQPNLTDSPDLVDCRRCPSRHKPIRLIIN